MDQFSHLQMTRKIAHDGVAEEEYNFSNEVQLGVQDPIWKEKYRPRKPRFFNRVHTVCCWVGLGEKGEREKKKGRKIREREKKGREVGKRKRESGESKGER